MDSRTIHRKSQHLLPKVKWHKIGYIEWIYSGSADEVRFEFVASELLSFLDGELFFHVKNRNDSYQITRQELLNSLSPDIGSIDCIVWNSDFSKVVEFNKIGVFRKGEYK